jgi:hypothetical protein
LLRQGATLADWTDVTAALGQTSASLPWENRPAIFDINNDGHVDIGATGDENTRPNLLNSVAALTSSGARLGNFGELVDLNGDGYLDSRQPWRAAGKANLSTKLNRYGGNVPNVGDPPSPAFFGQSTPVPIPAGLPANVADELSAMTVAPHSTATGNRYAGPAYEHIDLNGDGLLDLVIQYGGKLFDVDLPLRPLLAALA